MTVCADAAHLLIAAVGLLTGIALTVLLQRWHGQRQHRKEDR
jgi:hypothetical protein